jgi:two-component system chemotaxis response regulator CheY
MYKRVLVVDDDPGMRVLMHLLLNKSDYQIVAEGEDGEQAVKLYAQVQPDCVLLDLMMPRVDGLTALKMIMEAYPRAQVIICSGKRNGDTVREAYAAGARDFITKPFGRAELQRALERTATGPATVA